jgi:DNA mismatch repair ATPase MutL
MKAIQSIESSEVNLIRSASHFGQVKDFAQELIINSIESNCLSVKVSIFIEKDVISLAVEDDGKFYFRNSH